MQIGNLLKIPKMANGAKGLRPKASGVSENHTVDDEKLGDKGAFPLTSLGIQDRLAPKEISADFDYIKIDGRYFRTLIVTGYPRFVYPGWLDAIINFDHSLALSFYIYPLEGKGVLDSLRRKITEMEAEIATDIQRGKVIDPSTQAKLEDARGVQEQLVRGSERFFEFSFYMTIPADTLEELNSVTQQVESTLGSLLVTTRHATLSSEDGFLSTLPLGSDTISVTRNMDTTSLATTFPFSSTELSSDKGVLYGINEDNDSLVVFDRFSLENYNSVLFATSGAGKSFATKLEVLRSLMLGTEVFIIDPEEEYKKLCEAAGGEFVGFSFTSEAKINPFDLATARDDENQFALKILYLHSLLAVMLGGVSGAEQAILDRALIETYRKKGITPDQTTYKNPPPQMADLYTILAGMNDTSARALATRLEKFVRGSFAGIFDKPTNISLRNKLMVFSVRDLEEALRPIAMFVILDFIWTRVKESLKKRLLVVDEAWHMMKYPDTARFLYSIAKRSRKYWLGLTTITQDVEDFLSQDLGKAIVTNSSLRFLMKQSPAAIDAISGVFKLSEGERQLLLSADVGEGIFFAGANHVAIRTVASDDEYKLITSKPADVAASNAASLGQPKTGGGQLANQLTSRPEDGVSATEPTSSSGTTNQENAPVLKPIDNNRPVFTVEEEK